MKFTILILTTEQKLSIERIDYVIVSLLHSLPFILNIYKIDQ